jgi:hypothetical protein
MINEFRKLVEKNASTLKTSQRTDTQYLDLNLDTSSYLTLISIGKYYELSKRNFRIELD